MIYPYLENLSHSRIESRLPGSEANYDLVAVVCRMPMPSANAEAVWGRIVGVGIKIQDVTCDAPGFFGQNLPL